MADREQREQQLRERMQRERLHRFDLSEGAPWRVMLVTLGDREHALLLIVHHIVSDVVDSGAGARAQYAIHRVHTSSAKSLVGAGSAVCRLRNMAAAVATGRGLARTAAILERATPWGSPGIRRLMDRPLLAVESFKGTALSFELPATFSGALRELGRREGATLFRPGNVRLLIRCCYHAGVASRTLWSDDHIRSVKESRD